MPSKSSSVSDDPPERISAWLATVSEPEVHRLDQQLLLDLLRIETRADAWEKVLDTVLTSIDQLVRHGNVAVAQEMLDTVVAAGRGGTAVCRRAPARASTGCAAGRSMKHVVLFIRQAQEKEMKAISAFLPQRSARP